MYTDLRPYPREAVSERPTAQVHHIKIIINEELVKYGNEEKMATMRVGKIINP